MRPFPGFVFFFNSKCIPVPEKSQHKISTRFKRVLTNVWKTAEVRAFPISKFFINSRIKTAGIAMSLAPPGKAVYNKNSKRRVPDLSSARICLHPGFVFIRARRKGEWYETA